jgi:dihydroxy-acid dehydratase
MVNTGVGNAGPQGGPSMPEWGMLPIPKKLVK